MDIRSYDEAFVTKLGAARVVGEGYFIQPGILKRDDTELSVPVLFDLPEDWWNDDEYGVEFADGERTVVGVNVKRIGIVPDQSRNLPGFKGRELSENPDTPNTWNIQSVPSQPVTILYTVQMVAESQSHMNKLIEHALTALPTQGFGTVLTVNDRLMPFRTQSVRNKTEDSVKGPRKFMHEYTYAVEAWLVSLECEKVGQILTVDLTFTDDETFEDNVVVTESS